MEGLLEIQTSRSERFAAAAGSCSLLASVRSPPLWRVVRAENSSKASPTCRDECWLAMRMSQPKASVEMLL